MSRAWISGILGQAVVVDESDGQLTFFRLDAGADASEPPKVCSPRHLQHLLSLASDIEEVDDPGPAPFVIVREALDRTWRQDRALRLALSAVDRSLPDELRIESADRAEILLDDRLTRRTVRNRLLSAILPAAADTTKLRSGSILAELFFQASAMHQEISLAHSAWARATLSDTRAALAGGFLEDALKPACIAHGGFAALVDSLLADTSTVFKRWAYSFTEKPAFAEESVAAFLQAWAEEAFRIYQPPIRWAVARDTPRERLESAITGWHVVEQKGGKCELRRFIGGRQRQIFDTGTEAVRRALELSSKERGKVYYHPEDQSDSKELSATG